MKVEDLMIEDWLLYKSDSNDFPIQITREMFNKELVVWNDRFEPIQLTPEILKKNGFVNSYIDLSLNKDSVYKYNHFYSGNSVIVDMESNNANIIIDVMFIFFNNINSAMIIGIICNIIDRVGFF